MKKLTVPFLLAAVLLLAPATSAFAENKIATVDLRRLFEGYYRTQQSDTRIKDEANELDKDKKTMLDRLQTAKTDYKTLLEKANEPLISVEEREKRKKSAETELSRITDMERELQQFDTQARATLDEKLRRMRENILGEIKAAIEARAKAGHYTLVLDVGSESFNKTAIVLYTSGEDDLTDAVLKQLNTGAPLALPRPDEKKNDKK